ncbi:spore coat protein U domain-containing protein [Salmonella enterica subsp. enterica]|nr:spore coat protein U domain-containing protein [Salmonella enterica]EBY0806353.1 hypothetical protein [Salmonella enterica subsp. enterica serovar Berlin]ECF3780408.1 hypothetical protein [Salmonella enterica subsp. enterica serovar Oslo]EDR2105589.1 spore coat protein U domain-containing protein [Salmonella enterica subsp. enterica]EDW0612955.1 spore coat protein U domain-containing protein [Salmonella enterica subsp. enterica serovar Ball]EGZ4377866.1 spore coat protein U domain-containin
MGVAVGDVNRRIMKRTQTDASDNPDNSSIVYQFYQDSSQTKVWGNSNPQNGGGNVVSKTGTGKSQEISVYAKIATNQVVRAGDYQDTITATIEY